MISVIIPAHNEAKHIVQNVVQVCDYLQGFMSANSQYEVIVVDDCSSDDTFLLAVENLKNENVRVYRKVVAQGKGAAVKTGWRFAKGDYIIIMDADLQIKPKEMAVFFRQMEHFNADVVIGNKRHLFSNVRYSLKRWVVSNIYNSMCRLLLGISLRDTQCGFKLFKKAVLDQVMDRILVKEFAFDLEVLVALKENNIRVADAPVMVSAPKGIGSVSARNAFRTGKDTLAVWWRKTKGWYKCAQS